LGGKLLVHKPNLGVANGLSADLTFFRPCAVPFWSRWHVAGPLYHVPTIGDDGCSKIKAGPLVDSERPLGVKRGQHPNSVGVFGTQGRGHCCWVAPEKDGDIESDPHNREDRLGLLR